MLNVTTGRSMGKYEVCRGKFGVTGRPLGSFRRGILREQALPQRLDTRASPVGMRRRVHMEYRIHSLDRCIRSLDTLRNRHRIRNLNRLRNRHRSSCRDCSMDMRNRYTCSIPHPHCNPEVKRIQAHANQCG
jgi:hypothetical protein